MSELTTKVTLINRRYHIRLLQADKVISESACLLKEDISYCITELLRWYNKSGGTSRMADSSRHRLGRKIRPSGKVWLNI